MKQLPKSWGEEGVSGPCCFPLPLVRQGSFTIYSSRPQKPILPKIGFGPCWLNRQRLRKKKLDSEGCPAVWLSLTVPKQMNPISPPLDYCPVYGQLQRNSGPKNSQLRVDPHPQVAHQPQPTQNRAHARSSGQGSSCSLASRSLTKRDQYSG